MKLLCASLLLSAAMAAEQTCTYGKLYVSDADSTNVHIFDISTGTNTENLAPEQTISVAGGAGAYLEFTASGKEVIAAFRGTEEIGYTDGVVSFIDTGVRTEAHGDHSVVEYVTASVLNNAEIDCARAIHFMRHDNKIAVFCDGSYAVDPQVNSTVVVVDESKLTDADGGVVYEETLQGSHHGVCIPVDDNHVLYSLASQDRINRAPGAEDYHLPSTFQVVDYQGNVLHSINDEADKDNSCSGFHGGAASDNTFSLACDPDHGGILIVDYEENGGAYTSRALSYPESYTGHRTGTFIEHPKNDLILGNFMDRTNGMYHILAFRNEESGAITEKQVLSLEDRECGVDFEVGIAQAVIVMMPTGMLHVYKYTDAAGWNELAKVEVVPGMEACTEVVFTPGVTQAFVLKPADKMLYTVDVSKLVHEGGNRDEVVKTSQLGFTPFDAVLGGVPLDVACTEHDDEHGDDDVTSGAVAVGFWMSAAATVAGGLAFVLL